MEYRDKDSSLVHYLYEDYEAWLVKQRHTEKPPIGISLNKLSDFEYSWKKFIESNELGLRVNTHDILPGAYIYHIVDEKKWLINKLKYGL